MSGGRLARGRRLVTIVSASVLLVAGFGIDARAASAYDHYPCGPRTTNRGGDYVQYCPLTRAGVPVFKDQYRTMSEARNANGITGWLTYGGCSNWFYGQIEGQTFTDGGYSNDWWAATVADNGAFGVVSEIYFRGGINFERDRGLEVFDQNLSEFPAPACGTYVP